MVTEWMTDFRQGLATLSNVFTMDNNNIHLLISDLSGQKSDSREYRVEGEVRPERGGGDLVPLDQLGFGQIWRRMSLLCLRPTFGSYCQALVPNPQILPSPSPNKFKNPNRPKGTGADIKS